MINQKRLDTLIDLWRQSDSLDFNDWCERRAELDMLDDACPCCGGLHLDFPEIDCRAFYPPRVR